MSKIKEYLAEMEDCHDMADVCELAHKRTVAKCAEDHKEVNCTGCADHDPIDEHYSEYAQGVFNDYYDQIIEHAKI